MFEDILYDDEKRKLKLRELYVGRGYRRYTMSRFEEYRLYLEHRGFLGNEPVLTFTDTDGRLMALKPDVTLSIVKNVRAGVTQKFYYDENVYRATRTGDGFREIAQVGLEVIGDVDAAARREVVELAGATLRECGSGAVLVLGHMGYVSGLLDAAGLDGAARREITEHIRGKNAGAVTAAAASAGVAAENTAELTCLTTLNGEARKTLLRARELCRNDAMRRALRELESAAGEGDRIDLSLINDISYYNGLVFRGYVAGVSRRVLSGGQYDALASRFCPGAGAIGFALYTDELTREPADSDGTLTIALPKGRLGDAVRERLCAAGYPCADDSDRRLVLEAGGGVRYLLAKPSDVAVYVERGAADVGIVGYDVLAESRAGVYELLDLGLGRCRMCVAAGKDYTDDGAGTLRVATKYPNIAKSYFDAQGRETDMIEIHGSVELAPIMGMSDVIVDIVESGKTLRENGLAVVTEFMDISARLIANKASYVFRNGEITQLVRRMGETISD